MVTLGIFPELFVHLTSLADDMRRSAMLHLFVYLETVKGASMLPHVLQGMSVQTPRY